MNSLDQPDYIRGVVDGDPGAGNPSEKLNDRIERLATREDATPDVNPFDDECGRLREHLRHIGAQVLKLKKHPILTSDLNDPPIPTPDTGEMVANVQLSYRHIEDAIMRLGKAIQAFDGGKSVYQR